MMELSEAIRLGAMTGPQAFGRYFSFDQSCAMGSAAIAIGLQLNGCLFVELRLAFPILTLIDRMDCPVCGRLGQLNLIPHLNDNHRWSREQIANWVETVEQKHVQETVSTNKLEILDLMMSC